MAETESVGCREIPLSAGGMIMKDSGFKEESVFGGKRDADPTKVMLDLISPYAEEREAAWMTAGAVKHGPRDWEKGMPFSWCIQSIERHLLAIKKGLKDEDHLAALRCRAGFLLHYEEMIKRGKLPKELDDLPKYES